MQEKTQILQERGKGSYYDVEKFIIYMYSNDSEGDLQVMIQYIKWTIMVVWRLNH